MVAKVHQYCAALTVVDKVCQYCAALTVVAKVHQYCAALTVVAKVNQYCAALTVVAKVHQYCAALTVVAKVHQYCAALTAVAKVHQYCAALKWLIREYATDTFLKNGGPKKKKLVSHQLKLTLAASYSPNDGFSIYLFEKILAVYLEPFSVEANRHHHSEPWRVEMNMEFTFE